MKVDYRTKYEYSILDLCEDLHMSATGTGDQISGERQGEMMAALVKRLCNWTQDKHAELYDNAVKLLVLVTLTEQLGKFDIGTLDIPPHNS